MNGRKARELAREIRRKITIEEFCVRVDGVAHRLINPGALVPLEEGNCIRFWKCVFKANSNITRETIRYGSQESNGHILYRQEPSFLHFMSNVEAWQPATGSARSLKVEVCRHPPAQPQGG